MRTLFKKEEVNFNAPSAKKKETAAGIPDFEYRFVNHGRSPRPWLGPRYLSGSSLEFDRYLGATGDGERNATLLRLLADPAWRTRS
jgi:hypothetical protein